MYACRKTCAEKCTKEIKLKIAHNSTDPEMTPPKVLVHLNPVFFPVCVAA